MIGRGFARIYRPTTERATVIQRDEGAVAKSPISIRAKTAKTTSGAWAAEISCSESNDNISIETVTCELDGTG